MNTPCTRSSKSGLYKPCKINPANFSSFARCGAQTYFRFAGDKREQHRQERKTAVAIKVHQDTKPHQGYDLLTHASGWRLRISAWVGLLFFCLIGLISGCAGVQPSAQDQEIRARMDLASSYLANDQPRRALRQLKALHDRAVKNPDYHYLHGLTSARLDRSEEAKTHFQEAVNLQADFGQAWNNLGKVYISLDREEKARQAFVQALDIPTYLTPEYPAYNLARLNVQSGRPEQAKERARQSLQANPGFVPAILLLSELLTAEERLQEAVDVVRRGLNIHPENARLMQDLAQNLLRLGQQEQARQWFERIAQDADPQSEAAQMAEDYLELLPE